MRGEKRLQTQTMDALSSTSPRVEAFRVSDAGPGFPDLLVCRLKRFCLVELKDEDRADPVLSTLYRKEQIAWGIGYLSGAAEGPLYTLVRHHPNGGKGVYLLWRVEPWILKRAEELLLSSVIEEARLYYRTTKLSIIAGIIAELI